LPDSEYKRFLKEKNDCAKKMGGAKNKRKEGKEKKHQEKSNKRK